ncbi:methylated-DNA--[protein]-cysteine S-methyltransferase [Pleionea sp. CnH1-48]|uniref:methylated-DNA--[protein]-cysteine S-methyltransferase n=1 Tax=Pleionea sp. CnH1-48 TaxID=2954494 RepID=UPI00211152FF|nr:methylated-DNA--[protein]-cysteine S-methyltransferase [Pleionea sp. CnH1-48]
MFIDYFESPIGTIELTATEKGLSSLYFHAKKHTPKSTPLFAKVKQQLSEYFAQERTTFDIALDLKGTDFQQQVWAQLLTIPSGETSTYAQIAKTLDRPKAVRAVGAANGKNPISIIVPCHRVIGSNGKLTGYAGGLERKQWLLEHEGAVA